MRKANREIKDEASIRAIIEEARVCRIGLSDDGMPYVVPLNFGLGENCLYFHCATEGLKLDIIRKNNRVCFEMDLLREIRKGADSCGDWTTRYDSVIGFGQAVILANPADKRAALDRIMEHYGATGPFSYQDAILAMTVVIRIDIDSITGKRRE